ELMFSDVIMPGGMDGIQLAGKARELRPSLPIVLASGYADRASPGPDLRMLRKPYELDRLLTVLNEEMNSRALH
ncbi:MAG: hypothetical protein JWQ11_1896, partial [Rhizobacter sp.]|nr:hypothetical protein [Rhizobacter sp.]